MASSSILVNFPFPLSQMSSATISVCRETKIFEIIKGCLIQQSRQDLLAGDYCLVIHPQDSILLPFLSVNDYRKSFLQNSQVSFYLIPKMYFTVRLNIISVQITTVCDSNQSVSNLLSQINNACQFEKISPTLRDNKLSQINTTYISDHSKLVSYIKNQPYPVTTKMNKILKENKYKTPVITIKRQNVSNINTDNSIKPVFKNFIEIALFREKDQQKVPYFLTKIFQLVENNRDTIGIYRKSGDFNTIDSISKKIDSTVDREQLNSYLEQQNAHDLACTVKLYLRQLTEPIIPSYLSKDFYSVLTIGDSIPRRDSSGPILNEIIGSSIDEEMTKFKRSQTQTLPIPNQNILAPSSSSNGKTDKKIVFLRSLLRALPKANYDLLEALCEHIEKVVDASATNQMNYKNIAICMGTNLVKVAQGIDSVKETTDAQSICQLIFENWKTLFQQQPMQQQPKIQLFQKVEKQNKFRLTRDAVAFINNQNQNQNMYQGQNMYQNQFRNLNVGPVPIPPPNQPSPIPFQAGNMIFGKHDIGHRFPPNILSNRNQTLTEIKINPSQAGGFIQPQSNIQNVSTDSSDSRINSSTASSQLASFNNDQQNSQQQQQQQQMMMQQPMKRTIKQSVSLNSNMMRSSGQKITVPQNEIIILEDKNGGKMDITGIPLWIVKYKDAIVKIDSSALEPISETEIEKQQGYPPIVAPDPTLLAPLNPFGHISLKSLSKRNYLQPDDQASSLAINSPDACHVAEWLRGFEAQLDQITSEYNNEGKKPETCAKLKRLLRQLSGF